MSPFAALALVLLAPALASAQPAAAAQFTEATAARPTSTDDTQWTVGLNGQFNYGNARSLALGATTHFLVRRDVHQFTLDLTFQYGMASLRDATTQQFGAWNANAQNLNGRIRYDVWLDADDSLFATVVGRNDPFAGLAFRFQGQLGWARNLFTEAEGHHRGWFELGGDFTYDQRFPSPFCGPAPGGVTLDRATCTGSDGMSYRLSQDEIQPSARAFLGYDNHMNADWNFLTGVEVLVDLRGDPHWRNVRINWRSTLGVTLAQDLSATVNFNVLYDGEPVPGFQEVDTQTLLGVNYTLH
jgi:hypothetical protein